MEFDKEKQEREPSRKELHEQAINETRQKIQQALNGGRSPERELLMPGNSVNIPGLTGGMPIPQPTGGSDAPSGGSGNSLKDWLIQKESSGRTNAKNPNSSAFGLGQLIAANRQKYAAALGVHPDTTDYDAQSKMMDMYVQERYGSYAKAVEFWKKNGWY